MEGRRQLEKIKEWHRCIFDWEIENPQQPMYVCAEHFNVSENWLSIIKLSDIYIEYAAKRREDHNAAVSKSVIEQVEEVASISLEVLQERISSERDKIGLGIVNDAASMALKALGFGGNKGGREGTQLTVVLGGADAATLERARDKMRLINAQTPETIEGTVDEEQPPELLPAP